MQINYNNQIEELRQRKETVAEKLTQLKEASEESWEDLKADIEEGINLLKSAVNSVIPGLPAAVAGRGEQQLKLDSGGRQNAAGKTNQK